MIHTLFQWLLLFGMTCDGNRVFHFSLHGALSAQWRRYVSSSSKVHFRYVIRLVTNEDINRLAYGVYVSPTSDRGLKSWHRLL